MIRQGEGAAGLKRLERERAELERKIDKICDAEPLTRANGHRLTKPGDLRQLRGIPCLSKGVTGAVNHTRPDREIVHKLSR